MLQPSFESTSAVDVERGMRGTIAVDELGGDEDSHC